MKKLILGFLLAGMFILNSCGESTDTVDSGTYQGTVDEVEASKDEIYVKTGDGKTLELYFTDETELTKNGDVVDFSTLQKGQNVEVTVEKVGKRLDPIAVKILD